MIVEMGTSRRRRILYFSICDDPRKNNAFRLGNAGFYPWGISYFTGLAVLISTVVARVNSDETLARVNFLSPLQLASLSYSCLQHGLNCRKLEEDRHNMPGKDPAPASWCLYMLLIVNASHPRHHTRCKSYQ